MKEYVYIEYLLLFLKLIMYKRKIENRLIKYILNASATVRTGALAFSSKEYSIL